VEEGKAYGLSDKGAELYAAYRGKALNNAVKNSYGHDLGMSSRNPQQIEKEALADQAKFYRDHGVSAQEAGERAQRDMRLIKESGEYGGINYAAPVGQIRQKMDNLEKSAQESRHEIVMGGPGRGTRRVERLSMGKLKEYSSTKYEPIIQEAADKHGVDPNLIRAVITLESNFDPNIVNQESGATGLMQLTPKGAGAGMTDAARKNPRQNIMKGTAFLKEMLDKYHGREDMALRAYHSGPGNVDQGNLGPKGKAYAPQVLAYRNQYASVDLGTQAKDIQATNPDMASTSKPDYEDMVKRAEKLQAGVRGKN